MSKTLRKKSFKAASLAYFLSLGALATSLFAYFSTSSTFSWFASNKEVEASGMSISIKGEDDVDIEAHYYRYVEEQEDDGESGKKGTGVYHVQRDPDELSLTRYDQIFTDDNDYAPLLIQLRLYGGSYKNGDILPLKIFHDSSKDKEVSWTLEESDADNFSIADDDATYHLSSYLSSVVSVKAMVHNDETIFSEAEINALSSDSSALEADFEEMRNSFADNAQRFVSSIPSTGAASKSDLDFSNDANLAYEEVLSEKGIKTCTAYVWMDYDVSQSIYDNGAKGHGLINAYIDQMKSKLTTVDAGYPLGSDITELTIKVSE